MTPLRFFIYKNPARLVLSGAFLLSLLLHFVPYGLLLRLALSKDENKNNKIEITLIENADQSKKTINQVVRKLELPQIKQNPDLNQEEALFLSDKAQRVKKQTKALKLGLTRNSFSAGRLAARSAPSIPSPSLRTTRPRAKSRHESPPVSSASQISPLISDMDLTQFQQFSEPSQIGHMLPDDIAVGLFTALNTDRFTYYSFFERIEDKIRYPWESQVLRGLKDLSNQRLANYPYKKAVTQIEIVLNLNGDVENIYLLKSSAINEFDQAAIDSFLLAKQFGNPPRGLAEEDGKIHLKFQFMVLLDRAFGRNQN